MIAGALALTGFGLSILLSLGPEPGIWGGTPDGVLIQGGGGYLVIGWIHKRPTAPGSGWVANWGVVGGASHPTFGTMLGVHHLVILVVLLGLAGFVLTRRRKQVRGFDVVPSKTSSDAPHSPSS